ncbi:hypothetical protein ACH3XW_50120 [Acanthocheilonema viteae]
MPYFLLIFLILYQLQKNNAEGEMTSTPSATEIEAGATGSSILTTTKGTQCLASLTVLPGWLTLTSLLYEIIRSF